MTHLPKLVDNRSSSLVQVATYLLVPVVLVLALPLLCLLILVLYLAALWHGVRVLTRLADN